MLKNDLKKYIGQNVIAVIVGDHGKKKLKGILGFVYDFSEAYGWRKPNYFYINDYCFRSSLVKELYVDIGGSNVRVG